jgi:hypothetical protein
MDVAWAAKSQSGFRSSKRRDDAAAHAFASFDDATSDLPPFEHEHIDPLLSNPGEARSHLNPQPPCSYNDGNFIGFRKSAPYYLNPPTTSLQYRARRNNYGVPTTEDEESHAPAYSHHFSKSSLKAVNISLLCSIGVKGVNDEFGDARDALNSTSEEVSIRAKRAIKSSQKGWGGAKLERVSEKEEEEDGEAEDEEEEEEEDSEDAWIKQEQDEEEQEEAREEDQSGSRLTAQERKVSF